MIRAYVVWVDFFFAMSVLMGGIDIVINSTDYNNSYMKITFFRLNFISNSCTSNWSRYLQWLQFSSNSDYCKNQGKLLQMIIECTYFKFFCNALYQRFQNSSFAYYDRYIRSIKCNSPISIPTFYKEYLKSLSKTLMLKHFISHAKKHFIC